MMPAEATVGRMARLAKEAGAEGSPEGAKTPVRERREGMADQVGHDEHRYRDARTV